MNPQIPTTSNGHKWWDETYAIYERLGPERFRAWLAEKLRDNEAWMKVVGMFGWADRNSEYNLDPTIAKERTTREGTEVSEEDVARDVESMVEGMRPAQGLGDRQDRRTQMARSVTVPLPSEDWGEVYYALESKVKAIEAGYYDPEDNEGDNAAWVEHLRSIMSKISSKVEV